MRTRGTHTPRRSRRSIAVGAVGGLLLVGAAGAAVADEVDGNDVDVTVNIDAADPSGALTMSVASASTSLAEVASADPDVRQFDGVLPTVTVTDDRDQAPAGVFWYVTGQASALTTAGGESIAPGNLGWTPRLLTDGDGQVTEGDPVDTVLDSGDDAVGLVGAEFLALALDSGEAAQVGTWSANADLTLKTPKNVAPGAYSGTITLTLWEDAQ